jgi:hypothetical protein
MSKGVKVQEVTVLSSGAIVKKTIKSGLTLDAAIKLQEDKSLAQEKKDLRAMKRGEASDKIVSYLVIGSVEI